MKFLPFILIVLLVGCSENSAPKPAQRPQFDIRSADVVTAAVTQVSASDHKAEIALTLTDQCAKRYEPFGQQHAKQSIDLLANGRLLLEGLYASEQLSTQMTVYIFTSVDDARALADSLNTK